MLQSFSLAATRLNNSQWIILFSPRLTKQCHCTNVTCKKVQVTTYSKSILWYANTNQKADLVLPICKQRCRKLANIFKKYLSCAEIHNVFTMYLFNQAKKSRLDSFQALSCSPLHFPQKRK